MSEKSNLLLSIRPVVKTEPAINPAEHFQNLTLRPILRFQNDTLIRIFRKYVVERKNTFNTLTEADKKIYITNALRQDVKLHSLLKGVIIGHFTEEEWQVYLTEETDINRRLSNLISQRLLSNLADI
ncbi:glyoxalase [Dyadobacter sp. CY345]|uniref:glyoxalase n=1 Tax=Dyadobacter sp. CY345 TaxID=2909335 RepID=UPI001F206521|nr:glyoxalase [Dyadobacter sp. CY345]MCF2444119.1 glyoxalase [Dyadobacter sp. CY345]